MAWKHWKHSAAQLPFNAGGRGVGPGEARAVEQLGFKKAPSVADQFDMVDPAGGRWEVKAVPADRRPNTMTFRPGRAGREHAQAFLANALDVSLQLKEYCEALGFPSLLKDEVAAIGAGECGLERLGKVREAVKFAEQKLARSVGETSSIVTVDGKSFEVSVTQRDRILSEIGLMTQDARDPASFAAAVYLRHRWFFSLRSVNSEFFVKPSDVFAGISGIVFVQESGYFTVPRSELDAHASVVGITKGELRMRFSL